MPKFFAIENNASLQNPKESGLEELQGALQTTMDEIVSARGSVPLRWLALVDKLGRES